MNLKTFINAIFKEINALIKQLDFNIVRELKIKIFGFIYQYKNIVFYGLFLSLLTIVLYIFLGKVVILAIIALIVLTATTQIKK